MSDEEILCHNNSLNKHLNDLGFFDFETFEPNEPYQLNKNAGSKGLKNNASELAPIDSYNYDKIMYLLRSKLLFLEDVEFVESVLSFCYICDEKPVKYIIGAVATSFISIAAYFNRGIDSYFPLSCVAMSSTYAAWKLYKGMSEFNRNKSVTLYVKSLQNLCMDLNKVLRFLKEVEILSTGQVSSQNVRSAMYIPVNSVHGLNELPPWKTLPNLRKSVAYSLIDAINVFSCGCDYLSKFSPSWMDIKGFSSNNQVSGNPMKVMLADIKSSGGCISMKDLQVLNDNYLLSQSQFLKWVAFYLCPVVWKNSKDQFASFKNEILLKYMENTQTKICDISLKVKLNFDLQKVFTTCSETKDTLQGTYTDNIGLTSNVDLKELKEVQAELHQVFLLVLSTVQKAKSLEDCLDIFSNKTTEENYSPSIGDLKENLSNQLSIVRNDLAKVVKDYDYMYSKILSKNKSVDHEDTSNSLRTANFAYHPQNDNPDKIKVVNPDFTVSSPDEVFLAISGSKPADFEIDSDDWCIEKRPKIPQTLLTELSTTLKPIKKDFEERERLVLQKLGIQDIEDKDAEISNLSQNNPLNLTDGSTQSFPHKNCHHGTQNEGAYENTENSDVENEQLCTANSLLMASLLKMNVSGQQRESIEEECFSND